MSTVNVAFAASTEVPEHNDWLSARERAVLAGLRVTKRIADWRLGRWAAKQVARSVFGEQEVEIVAAPDGAPQLFVDGECADASISISHSNGIAMAVLSGVEAPVGCDLERIEPRSNAFVDTYFTQDEIASVTAAPEHERALLANALWSAKETVLKLTREGMRADVRDVEIELTHGSGWQPFRGSRRGQIVQGMWRVQDGWVHTIATGAL